MSGKVWSDLLKEVKRTTRTVSLCMRGDLLAARGQTLDDDEAKTLEAQIEEATVAFTFQGLSRQDYRALEAQHPDEDGAGWNLDTFPEALVRACLVEPVVKADEPLFAVLTSGQVERLFEAAFQSCNEVDDLPLL